jgi:hypothetical protein
MVTLVAVIATGEVFYERQKPTLANFFDRPFTDDELVLPIALLGIVAVAALAWLLSLYVRPGSLVIDPDAGRLRRERRPYGRTHAIDAPAGEWRVRLVYFNEEERARGAFKRLELDGPGLREVLLYTDVRDPDAMQRALQAIGPSLAAFESVVQRA